ncbi:MAG: hypothetical protein KDC38_05155, partial [Planctomycetes bacterium]|nr:hypothetical protein [Planctomycetota bacterium]
TGLWVRVDPNGTAAQPEDDHTVGGTQCYVTGQGTPGGPLGENDVDGGVTSLVSPVIDASLGETRVEFALWYSNVAGATPASDVFDIEISSVGGAAGSWVLVDRLGPATPEVFGGWRDVSFWVGDHTLATDDVVVRLRASDETPGSIVEAAVDDFVVRVVGCDPEPEFVRGDCNSNLGVQIDDVVFHLEASFGVGAQPSCPDACDSNDDGSIDISDAVYSLAYLFVGGPAFPPPFGVCGPDATPGDSISCDVPPCP